LKYRPRLSGTLAMSDRAASEHPLALASLNEMSSAAIHICRRSIAMSIYPQGAQDPEQEPESDPINDPGNEDPGSEIEPDMYRPTRKEPEEPDE
jgi:hypothetical protein